MSEPKHATELSEALGNLLRELLRSIPEIESHDFPTRVCARNRLNFTLGDVRAALINSGPQHLRFGPPEKRIEAGLRLIALAPAMADALLKVKQLWALGYQVRTCRPGTPDYVKLIKQGEAMKAEINSVIEQIEQGPEGVKTP